MVLNVALTQFGKDVEQELRISTKPKKIEDFTLEKYEKYRKSPNRPSQKIVAYNFSCFLIESSGTPIDNFSILGHF